MNKSTAALAVSIVLHLTVFLSPATLWQSLLLTPTSDEVTENPIELVDLASQPKSAPPKNSPVQEIPNKQKIEPAPPQSEPAMAEKPKPNPVKEPEPKKDSLRFVKPSPDLKEQNLKDKIAKKSSAELTDEQRQQLKKLVATENKAESENNQKSSEQSPQKENIQVEKPLAKNTPQRKIEPESSQPNPSLKSLDNENNPQESQSQNSLTYLSRPQSIFKQPSFQFGSDNLPDVPPPTPENYMPEELQDYVRGSKPEPTEQKGIRFTLNDYGWSFEHYAEQWASNLQKWWRAPADYQAGKVPQGGSVWISVRVKPDGELLDYKVYQSGVTAEMENKVIQALISSFLIPPLPEDFKKEYLVVNWQFIYPQINLLGGIKK